jgi:uncharacterized protein with GYD domain
MARYLVQGGYTAEAWAGLVKSPEDRTSVVRAAIESIGGKLECLYYTFGADDFVAIAELPDGVQAAALGVAVASTGRYRNYRTTPLLTAAEMVQAIRERSAGELPPSWGLASQSLSAIGSSGYRAARIAGSILASARGANRASDCAIWSTVHQRHSLRSSNSSAPMLSIRMSGLSARTT